MTNQQDLRAAEAAAELGISVPTLYAYVSRGLIHSHSSPDGSRERRYSRHDVQQLKERQAQRRDPARAAVTALNWGTPVLESSITLIQDGQLYYRGNDAIQLAQTERFESVVGLLWTGRIDDAVLSAENRMPTQVRQRSNQPRLSSLQRFQTRLPTLAASDPAAYDLRTPAIVRAGTMILREMVSEVAGHELNDGIASTLAQHWAPGIAAAERLIDGALILTADHELNVSSFTVRCVASAQAPLYDAVAAGIGALRGIKHGASTQRIEALLAEIEVPDRALTVLEDWLRRGETIPGFGHNLYPNGDPRAEFLISLCHQLLSDNHELALIDALVKAGTEVIRERPNVDLGLVAISRVLGLERGSALTMMTLGRMAGWVGHALEQYQLDQIIRPRAKYVGIAPRPTDYRER